MSADARDLAKTVRAGIVPPASFSRDHERATGALDELLSRAEALQDLVNKATWMLQGAEYLDIPAERTRGTRAALIRSRAILTGGGFTAKEMRTLMQVKSQRRERRGSVKPSSSGSASWPHGRSSWRSATACLASSRRSRASSAAAAP